MVFTESTILFLSSKKKIDFLKTTETKEENGLPSIKLLVRDKVCFNSFRLKHIYEFVEASVVFNVSYLFVQNDKDKANFGKMIAAIKESKKGKAVGVFPKDKFPGEFMDAWRSAFKKEGFDSVRV